MKRLLGVAFLLGMLALASLPAGAHAVLTASDPSAGERVERAPLAVTLTFDEPVETTLGSLRVLDAGGTVKSLSGIVHPAADPTRIAVRLPHLDVGRYVVAWQVVSADSHIVSGAYAFGVGRDAGPQPVLPADAGAALFLPFIHFGLLAGVLLGIGLPIGAATVGRGRPRTPYFLEFAGWILVVFCSFWDVAFRADLAGGALLSGFNTHVGHLRIVTMAAALVAIVAVSGTWRRWPWLWIACGGVLLTVSLAGHAAGSAPAVVGVAADVLHLLAAATWIGILAVGTTLEPTADLRRISPIAVAAVVAIVASGVVQTVRNVGSVTALASTAYGRDIDLKVILMLGALGVALVSRRALARDHFAIGRLLKLELWLLTAVLAVTAVLVESPLPREAAPLASTASTFNVRDLTVHVSATTSGERVWNVRVDGTDGPGAARPLDAVVVTVRENQRNVGPLAVPMSRTPTGSFAGSITLPFDGTWTARVSARSGDFDENHITLSLPEKTP